MAVSIIWAIAWSRFSESRKDRFLFPDGKLVTVVDDMLETMHIGMPSDSKWLREVVQEYHFVSEFQTSSLDVFLGRHCFPEEHKFINEVNS